MNNKEQLKINKIINTPYKYGFSTNIETDAFPKGLTTQIVNLISKKRNEPHYLKEFRLNSYKKWTKMSEPLWAKLEYKPIDYKNIIQVPN